VKRQMRTIKSLKKKYYFILINSLFGKGEWAVETDITIHDVQRMEGRERTCHHVETK
jgi:hypothetical protein